MRKYILLILFFLNCDFSFSQQLFENVYRKTTGGWMELSAFDDAPNGNLYAVGREYYGEALIMKLDNGGNILWNKRYSSPLGNVSITSIVSMPDGGFAAAGSCLPGDFFVLRGDSMGNVVWAWQYNNMSQFESISDITRTPSNGFILSCTVHLQLANIAGLDSSGNVLFFKNIAAPSPQTLALYRTEISADSNIFAICSSSYNPRLQLLKFDLSGNLIWSMGLGDTSALAMAMYGNSVIPTPDGGCVITGNMRDGQYTYASPSLCKINAQAGIDWISIKPPYPGEQHWGTCVRPTSDHGFVILSALNDTGGTPVTDLLLTKTDSAGNFLWTKKYAGVGGNPREVRETPNRGFIVASTAAFYGDPEILIFNTDSIGKSSCGESFITPVDSGITMPITTLAYNITTLTLTQTSVALTSDSGVYIQDYCQLISVPEERIITDISVFPNPFHINAAFHISEAEFKYAQLKIYNTIGELVRSEKIPNINSYILHRGDLTDGLYFFELRTNEYEILGSGKFIVE